MLQATNPATTAPAALRVALQSQTLHATWSASLDHSCIACDMCTVYFIVTLLLLPPVRGQKYNWKISRL